ncbi:MAG: hypothetical protein JXA92_05995 [candidate division Zixibacteria bacterium]|nr:hypothetical protein [candidate division Zixibacteria bacterium]
MRKAFIISFIFVTVLLAAGQSTATDLVDYALCDLRVLYFYETPDEIDWPTLYYLNDRFGCRVDLLTVRAGGVFHYDVTEVPDKEIYLNRYFVEDGDVGFRDTLGSYLFRERRPDIVIFGHRGREALYNACREYLLNLPVDSSALFNIVKVYQISDKPEEMAEPEGAVHINRRELYDRCRSRMELEIPKLFPRFELEEMHRGERLVLYELLKSRMKTEVPVPDFISGLNRIRLVPILDSLLADGAIKQAFIRKAKNALSFLNASQNTVGRQRVENIITGYKELIYLTHQSQSEGILSGIVDYQPYLLRVLLKTKKATLSEIGMNWEGRVILRDSPHGPRLKFRADLAVNGSEEVELSYIKYQPYWDTVAVVLDSVSRKVKPHQSFIREYLVDIDRAYLEASQPESLSFTAEIVYSKIQLPITTSIPIREAPDLKITFEPDFRFVQPTARLDVDRVVSSLNWKAVIDKPRSFEGKVKVNLETPRGVFAGAYRTEWDLEKGHATQTIRIPFSISNLFELGIHEQTISLIVDNRVIAVDTGIIRVAACHIDDTVKVGFMPDTTGLLEDILRMTDAAFQPLTDRALQTGDLEAYNVIVVGSGAFRDFPALKLITERLIDYLRNGGSLVILGQPYDWPEGVLPVSFVPAEEAVRTDEITLLIDGARILSAPHKISETEFKAYFDRKRRVASAVVTPSEKVFVTPSGGALLSVSRLGEGQIIYCGLPLVDMISELNIEAIHLLANILNY